MKHIIQQIFICFIAATSFSQNSARIDFAVENIEAITKIVITEQNGVAFTLIKGNEQWSDDQGNCVIQKNVGLILDAIKNIEFKEYLPNKVVQHFSDRDLMTRVKVEIYQNSECIKTWYIGPPTADGNGQIMFLKSKNSNADHPVATKIRGFAGMIEPRFSSDNKKWWCTTIFALAPEKIASVEVTHFEHQKESFRVAISPGDIQVFNDTTRLSINDTASVYRYLGQFRNVHFERYDNDLSAIQMDSIKATQPFLKLELMDKDGFSKTLYCYRRISKQSNNTFDEDRFWCLLPPYDALVICQFFVFNSLIKGEYYFPLLPTNEK